MEHYSQSVEQKIKAAAIEALASIPETALGEATRSRDQLLGWLVGMHRVCQEPTSVIAESAPVIDEALAGMAGAGITATPEQARQVLSYLFGKLFSQGVLLSRDGENLWHQTGFQVDGTLKTVLASLGDNPAQPIGFMDDNHYVPTSSSKTMWLRQFCIGMCMTWPAAFKTVMPPDAPSVKLTERDRAIIYGCEQEIKDTMVRLVAIRKAMGPDDNGVTPVITEQMVKDENDAARAVVDAVKLARIQLPLLDQVLNRKAEIEPEHGPLLEKVDPVVLANAVVAYFGHVLSVERAGQAVQSAVITLDDARVTRMSLLVNLRGLFTAVEIGQDLYDFDKLVSVIGQSRQLVPAMLTEIDQAIKAGVISNIVKAAVAWCDREIDKVSTDG